MDILEVIKSAVSSVFGNKMRSILTMLGIIIGISAVIMITSIGSGFQSTVSAEFTKLGMNGLYIGVNSNEEITNNDRLQMDDMPVIMAHPEVEYAAPTWQANGSVKLKNPNESEMFFATGTTGDYRQVQPVNIIHGRFIIDNDVENKSPVVLIDENLSKKIFGRSDSIGEKITVSFWSGNSELTVVGVIKSEDYSAMFQMPSFIYMPITTVMDIYSSQYLDGVYVSVTSKDTMDKTALEITRLLEIKHNNTKKYQVQNLLKAMDSVNSVLGNITAFVALVAMISLIVGGIGVMNIMLVTVTERTREIGIRKSLGATDGNIQFQFLIEAMILTAIGGLIGIVIGYFGGFVLGGAIGLLPGFSLPVTIGTVIVSSLIGIVFGVYPARKAAQLDPIEALRYE